MDEIIGFSLSTLYQLKSNENVTILKNYKKISRSISEGDERVLGIFNAYRVYFFNKNRKIEVLKN